jgi:DNA-binding transcriptional ArsR family regulator
MTEEKLLILPLNDGTSKKISQALANETSRKVLELLCEEALSASQISQRLEIPLTTLHYNIENLLDAGLIKVDKIKYSRKGREIKYYSPTRKFIVIAPEKIEKEKVKDSLRKILFGAYFLITSTLAGYAFQRLYYSALTFSKAVAPIGAMKPIAAPATTAPAFPKDFATRAAEVLPQNATNISAGPLASSPSPVIGGAPSFGEYNFVWFVFGAMFALLLMFLWKKIEVKVK